jgi:PhoH-like ATPase
VLLAGLHEVLVNHNFEKLLIARPVVPLGKDVGYLPGTLQEKLYSWMLPVYDNMELIVHNAGMKGQAGHDDDHWSKDYYRGRKKGHRNGKGHDRNRIGLQPLDDLVEQGKISLEAITYMRGRSIPYQYILIDEVQNLTPHEVKTLVSRVGEGSKIILAGDPYQIDAPYLDFSSNGLVNINEKFKGQRLFGSVYLEKSERSELSKLVTELL